MVRPLGVESLGDEKHVLFEAPAAGATTPAALDMPVTVDDSAAAQLWTAKVSQYADLAIGRPVLLSVDLSMAYFFDPETGLAIQEAPVASVPTGDAVAQARS